MATDTNAVGSWSAVSGLCHLSARRLLSGELAPNADPLAPAPRVFASKHTSARGGNVDDNPQTCMLPMYSGAQFAFKILMIHWVLRFALVIAFCRVLHRSESQEIHCWKCFSHWSTQPFGCICDVLRPQSRSTRQYASASARTHALQTVNGVVGQTCASPASEGSLAFPTLNSGSRGRQLVPTCRSGGGPNRVVLMILPQVHLRKPCYDFSFL